MAAQPDRSDLEELDKLLAEWQRRQARRRFFQLYPDEDTEQADGSIIHARHKYPKHLEFFEAGARYRERCAMCANRVGKTWGMGAYETTAHLTGLYPDWWRGRRFQSPVEWWAGGKTNETTRDIVQAALLGGIGFDGARKIVTGTGMVPGELISTPNWKQGVPDLVDTVQIKHVPTGGWSLLGMKSYQQGRGSFEGTAKHGIWLDEEPPMDIYGECLIRTATVDGILLLTFTPLEGMSKVAMQFLPGGNSLNA